MSLTNTKKQIVLFSIIGTACLLFLVSSGTCSNSKTCKITVPHKGKSTLIVEDAKNRRMSTFVTTNSVFSVPEGDYQLVSYSAIAKDKNGIEWEAQCYFDNRRIKAKPDDTIRLEVGPPFEASVQVAKKGSNKVEMNFVLTGKGGDRYIISRRDGKSEPPGFQVLDESGKAVWNGSFKYG